MNAYSLKSINRLFHYSSFKHTGTFKILFFYFILFTLLFCYSPCSFGFVNDLRANGYSLIPAPQKMQLTGESILIDSNWYVETQLEETSIALKRLFQGVNDFYGIKFTGQSSHKIVLKIKKGIIGAEIDAKLANQGYQLEIEPGAIKITGNSEEGLFYGVQSFLQLLKPSNNNTFSLPEGTIIDWPDLELRFIHWDTKHHQDKMETLKRYLDQAAYFKINAVAFEIEDKYEYPSHPVIGAPGAFSKKEMQELTAYALKRFIQLVPLVQAPSHMAYVLKHPEFAHLRADESNYHICMCDEEAIQLIFDMYQDMIDATPGVNYFFVSTDEVYYAGICDKCALEYNEKNRSQTWVNYVNRVNDWMSAQNRRMLAWVEYPLLTNDIPLLSEGIIDAIMGTYRSKEWIANENKAGIEQLAYSSMQGAEFLFPNYFPTTYKGKDIEGRLADASNNVTDVQRLGANLIGTFAAAWDDAGLHSEAFWLGWATVTQYGWTSQKPTLKQNIADFMDVFYGKNSRFMVDIYRMLENGARFYENIWDQRLSVEREPGYGNSKGKGIGTERYDFLLDMPELPKANDLSRESSFQIKYARQVSEASTLIKENDKLIDQLMYAFNHVDYNRYNLEVFLSIAYLERFTINTVNELAEVDEYMAKACNMEGDASLKVQQLVEAHALTTQILENKKNMWNQFTNIWEKSRFEKCRSFDGKNFVHVLDDVKDHFADRRLGLEYMMAPFERMHIAEWRNELAQVIKEYAQTHNVPITGVEAERLED